MAEGRDQRGGSRQPATAMRIKLKYPDVETFIQKYAVNISRGGIFIATKAPKAVGTNLRFEFLLTGSDGAEPLSVIRGEGQVQWTRDFDPTQPQKPHGMGVKFTHLDPDSQAVIERALQARSERAPAPPRPAPPPVPEARPREEVTRTGEETRTGDDSPSGELTRVGDDGPGQGTGEVTRVGDESPSGELTRVGDEARDPDPPRAGASPVPTTIHDTRPIDMPELVAAAAAAPVVTPLPTFASFDSAPLDGPTAETSAPPILDGQETTAPGHVPDVAPATVPIELGGPPATTPVEPATPPPPSPAEPSPPPDMIASPPVVARAAPHRPVAAAGGSASPADPSDEPSSSLVDDSVRIVLERHRKEPERASRRASGDQLDRLAADWGITAERLRRVLSAKRPRLAQATRELEQLLRRPRQPKVTREEAVAGLAALLGRR